MNPLDILMGIFVWLLGLCVGSFLNVVIYRLPLGLSLSNPRRSFCPRCKHFIAWFDNLPVLSWLILGGRCRRCRNPIGAQYPLVEACTGLAFATVYGLLVVAGARNGISHFGWDLDAAALAAWLVLVAALIACSGMDFSAYMIDVRVTHFALLAGILLLAFWNRPEITMPVAQTPIAAGLTAAFVVGVIVTAFRSRESLGCEPTAIVSNTEAGDPQVQSDEGLSHFRPAPRGPMAVAAVLMAGLGLVLAVSPALPNTAEALRFLVPGAFAALLAVLCLAGGEQRAADDELSAAIESEAPAARRMALAEIVGLLPAMLAGGLAFVLLTYVPGAAVVWMKFTLLSWGIATERFSLQVGTSGLVFSICGAMTGIALGWLVRISFTLIFGREAFGVGDIHILAAAGAAAGWDVVLAAFPLSVGVALAMFLVSLLRKRAVLLAFGPPLAMGFVLALWLNRPIAELAHQRLDQFLYVWHERRDIALMAIGLLLVGAAVAVILARVVRRLVEREPE